MPNPSEKAKELIGKFKQELSGALYSPHNDFTAKACALICVEEMIKIQENFYGLVLTEPFRQRCIERVEYLEQVKQITESI